MDILADGGQFGLGAGDGIEGGHAFSLGETRWAGPLPRGRIAAARRQRGLMGNKTLPAPQGKTAKVKDTAIGLSETHGQYFAGRTYSL